MIDENKLIEDINNLKGLKRIKSCMYSESGNTLLNNLALNIVKEIIKLINEQPKDHDCDWYKHEYCAEYERNERLEKALDKACNELEDYASSYESPWCGRPFTKDQWEVWCMTDVE